jgi:hypothetical protein
MEIISPSGALKNIYENLEKYCSRGCGTITKFKDAFRHEITCRKPSCVGHERCKKKAESVINGVECCSEKCAICHMLKNGQTIDQAEMSLLLAGFAQRLVFNSKDIHTFCYWDILNKGTNIDVSQDMKTAKNTATTKKFSTVISKIGLTKTAHLVEMQVTAKPDKPVKIGVVTSIDFDMNQSFSDSEYGYAFYTLGQLRQGDSGKGRITFNQVYDTRRELNKTHSR